MRDNFLYVKVYVHFVITIISRFSGENFGQDAQLSNYKNSYWNISDFTSSKMNLVESTPDPKLHKSPIN